MNTHDEQLAWLTLLRAPALAAATVRDGVTTHGSAVAALEQRRRDARLDAATRYALRAPDAAPLAADRRWLDAPGHRLLAFTDADFPVLLRDVAHAPLALFVAGDPDVLWSPQIAIVGARSATASGLANARAFAREFALGGLIVTSGLAEGIDGAAHGAALDAGAATIAVLGTGPDIVYPRRHRELAARIAERGALVSEFPPGTPGKPENFPRRNRIISGLSLGTLVIEAGVASGSLITARLAAEQGREVFALPGSIHSPLARGCHKLIRDGALLVETAGEVLDAVRALGVQLGDRLRERLAETGIANAGGTRNGPGRDPDYAQLLGAIDDTPVGIDELAARSGLAVSALSSMLLVLELDGTVITAPGGRYALAH